MHNTEKCYWPSYTNHCTNCLVISVDGKGHCYPCMPTNTISFIRKNLLAMRPYTLFEMEYKKENANAFFLCKTKKLEITKVKLLSAPAEPISTATEQNFDQCIEFQQTTFKRCSLLIAFLDKGMWRLRFRLVVTPLHGLLVHKVTQTLKVINGQISLKPEENSVAIIGFVPKSTKFVASIRAHANETGALSEDNFDGYIGEIEINILNQQHEMTIADCFIPHSNKKMFNRKLYSRACSAPLSTFQDQRAAVDIFDAEPSMDSIHEDWSN